MKSPGAVLRAAGDLLPDTSRTTGVLGVAIDLARPHPEGIAALETRGMCSTNERCREKSMRSVRPLLGEYCGTK
jgi:hypothetical protein